MTRAFLDVVLSSRGELCMLSVVRTTSNGCTMCFVFAFLLSVVRALHGTSVPSIYLEEFNHVDQARIYRSASRL